jgi:transcriptional regulator with XRE-family HTH domain
MAVGWRLTDVFSSRREEYRGSIRESSVIGDRIRRLREERAWTQAHLADAAGVSLRTIQRLETLHSCSHETLLALAAALGVDVRELTGGPADHGESALWSWPTPRKAAWIGSALLLPAALFVTVNLLKFGIGVGAPYDLFAGIGGRLGAVGAFDALSPILFIGGPLLAVLLSLMAQVRPRVRFDGGAIAITGLSVTVHRFNLAVLLLAAAVLVALAIYLVGENLPDYLRAVITQR